MVAKTAPLPNIKKLFIPDPGFIIADVDLDRADAQVVAWEGNDDLLKLAFRQGLDVHTENARDIFNIPKHQEVPDHSRDMAKRGVHATNYGASARTLAVSLGITIRQAEDFQNHWFRTHPGIKDWHERIEADLHASRTVHNKFGYRRYYFDRIESLLPEALAWIPQSTVACVINRGLVNLHKNLPQVQALLQVHDSLVIQFPKAEYPAILPAIRDELLITVPYDDPLIIPVGIKTSAISWGDCKDTPWE